jgi:PAS domain S-box-containing protein
MRRGYSGWVAARTAALMAVALLLLSCTLVSPSAAQAQIRQVRRILIVNEAGVSYPAIDTINRGMRTEIERSPYKIEIYSEYLETILFPDLAAQQEMRSFILHKYQNRKPDVIVTVGPSALRFMQETHKAAFSGVPLVFCLPIESGPGIPVLDSDFTGVENDMAPAATLEAALRLQPDIKHVFVVGGQGNFDKQLQLPVRDQLKPFEKRVDLVYLTTLAMPDLLERLRHLPSRSVVLLTTIGEDAAGRHFKSSEVGPLVVSASNAPIFTLFDTYINHGEVGGDLSSFSEQGRIAGSMALRVLNGEKPQNIPRAADVTRYTFDWQALRRWGLKEGNLPPGSILINREPTLWERGRKYFIAGIAIIIVQSLLIFGLFWQRARKRRAEAELRNSEERFSKTFRRSPLVVAITRTSDSRFIDVNQSFEEQFGWTRDEIIGRTPVDFDLWVNADQRARFLEQLRTNGSVRSLEACLRRKDGETRTALVSAELIEVGGEPCTVSVAADITERKRAEDVLSTVSRRLIEAHEEERTRIARELHDDINQRLASLAVNLSGLEKDIPESDASTKGRVEQVRQDVNDLGKDVQALSHRLHSSKLEYLGLAVAAGGFCKEFAERHNVEVVFHFDNIPRNLPPEISLALFRVLQEALQNALKYSGTRRFEATLEGTSNEIHLSVHDSGVGFDSESAMNRHGLGLISMTERLKLVDGQLLIDSKPQCGATIKARVPLRSNVRSEVQVRVTTA